MTNKLYHPNDIEEVADKNIRIEYPEFDDLNELSEHISDLKFGLDQIHDKNVSYKKLIKTDIKLIEKKLGLKKVKDGKYLSSEKSIIDNINRIKDLIKYYKKLDKRSEDLNKAYKNIHKKFKKEDMKFYELLEKAYTNECNKVPVIKGKANEK